MSRLGIASGCLHLSTPNPPPVVTSCLFSVLFLILFLPINQCGMLFLGMRHPEPGAEGFFAHATGRSGPGDFGKTYVTMVRLV